MNFNQKICKLDSFKIFNNKVKLVTVVEGNQKAHFSIATTPRCRGGQYCFPLIAPIDPRYVPYNTD